MASYPLISVEQVQDLPTDPLAGFIAFESICRDSFNRYSDGTRTDNEYEDLQLSYMSRVAAAAHELCVVAENELKLSDYNYIGMNENETIDFRRFNRDVESIITRLQIRVARTQAKNSTLLSGADQQKITFHVNQLKERIEQSSLPQSKKKQLNHSLDELIQQLSGRKVDFARTMIIIASVFTTMSQGEAALIKLPETIASISQVIGLAKAHQDEILNSVKLIAHDTKPKALTSVKPRQASFDLDDEIPF
jgi:hypothetical protein